MTTLEIPSLAPDENKFSPAGSLGIINVAMATFEFPSLALDENKFSPAGSLGIIMTGGVTVRKKGNVSLNDDVTFRPLSRNRYRSSTGQIVKKGHTESLRRMVFGNHNRFAGNSFEKEASLRAQNLAPGDWFVDSSDPSRIFERLPGPNKIVEGIACVPAQQLRPTMITHFYMPVSMKVRRIAFLERPI